MSTAASQDTVSFTALHALSVKGMAAPGALAASGELDAGQLDAALGRLRDGGLASYLEARSLWRITPQGRARHAELVAEDLPAAARDRLRPAYQRFLPLNGQLKAICSRWQLRGGADNDHSDVQYDQACVADLAALHPEAVAVAEDLAVVRPRFGRYGRRLGAALGRLHDGELRAFTGVLCESYHDIWMELHRDLLLSLRITRETEEAATASGAGAGQQASAAAGTTPAAGTGQ